MKLAGDKGESLTYLSMDMQKWMRYNEHINRIETINRTVAKVVRSLYPYVETRKPGLF